MKRLLLIFALLFPLNVARAASVCTAYVSPPGPIPTWEQTGTVLCFHAGTYPHAALVRISAIGATYQSAPGETARLVGPGLELSGHDVTLIRIDIDNDGAGVPAVVLRGNDDTLSENEIHHGRYNGVDVRGTGAVIVGNQIHNFDSGVAGSDAQCVNVLPTGAAVAIVNNTIANCSGDGVQAFYPNSVPGPAPDLAGGTIANNTFSAGTIAYQENAIDLKRGAGWLISGNTISGYGRPVIPGGTGHNPAVFLHKWASNVLFSGNVISDSYNGAEVFGGSGLDTGANPVNISVINNVFDRIGPGYTLNIVGGISVTTAPNLVYPFGLPTPTQTAVPSVTSSQTATPQATGTATPTQTATERPSATATATVTPAIEPGCWDLRHLVPVPIACP